MGELTDLMLAKFETSHGPFPEKGSTEDKEYWYASFGCFVLAWRAAKEYYEEKGNEGIDDQTTVAVGDHGSG